MRKYLFAIGLVIIILVVWFLLTNQNSTERFLSLQDKELIVYKSPNCGCCDNYISYLKRLGVSVETVVTEEIEEIKNSHKIQQDMWSCHTTIVNDYVIEGHIPAEVLDKFLSERPQVAGIIMPGMPSGSPGMPGAKLEPFTIYSLLPDGQTELYEKF